MQATRRNLRAFVIAVLATSVAWTAACNDGRIAGTTRDSGTHDPWADAALAGASVTRSVFRLPDGRVATRRDSTHIALLDESAFEFGPTTGVMGSFTKRDSLGNRHTIVFVRQQSDDPQMPPALMIEYKNGKAIDALRARYERRDDRWIPVNGDFVVFDTVRGRASADIQFSVQNRRVSSRLRRGLSQLGDATATTIAHLFLPRIAWADGSDCITGPCDALFVKFTETSAAAVAAAKRAEDLFASCTAGDVVACAEVDQAIIWAAAGAAATAAWYAAWQTCRKTFYGPDGTMLDVVTLDPSNYNSASTLAPTDVAYDCVIPSDPLPPPPPPPPSGGGDTGGGTTPTFPPIDGGSTWCLFESTDGGLTWNNTGVCWLM